MTYSRDTLPLAVQQLNLTFVDPHNISYKALAEAFVTGHSGSNGFAELTLLLVSVGMWIWVHRLVTGLVRRAAASHPALLRLLPPSSIAAARAGAFSRLLLPLVLEWSLLVFPVLLGMTLLADWALQVFIAQVALVVALVLLHRAAFGEWVVSFAVFSTQQRRRSAATKLDSAAVASPSSAESSVLHRLNHSPKQFITNYRTSLMLYTSLAILAVDFTVFPRRFCKSESFGVGMMDGGVGSFIVSHAVTSIHARGGGGAASAGGGKDRPARTMLAQLVHILRSIFPLLVLGVARLFTIKAVQYQEHVSEYGVHWNFFFTLASVAVLSGALSSRIHPRSAALFGLGLLGAYQFALSHLGLTEFILTAPRTSILSANKEGIWSSIGYFSMYLMAVRLGFEVLGREREAQGWGRKIAKLAAVDLLLWCATLASSAYVQPSSRRMVNLTYALWMMSTNVLQLLQCLLLDAVMLNPTDAAGQAKRSDAFVADSSQAQSQPQPGTAPLPSLIIEAVNKNSLPFFLLCNLCTGAINLSMYTIFAPTLLAMSVLSVYSLLTCSVAVYLDYRGWIIKL